MSENTVPIQIQVTVCIASYNYAEYIAEAIESVFAQTYKNWELIIVDDASPDGSIAVILELQKRFPDKVTLLTLDENHGVCYTINQACSMAQGELIALLGADDRMLPDRLEKQVAYMQSYPDIVVACSLVEVIDENGIVQKGTSVFDKPINDLATQLLSGNFLNAPSVLFRRELINSVGLYNEKLPFLQDLDHWLRISHELEIARMDEVLTQYRIHGGNLSFKASSQQAFASIYETIFVILRAIKTRAERVKQSDRNNANKILELNMLAQAAKGIEHNLTGQFKWSVDLVYSLVLDICEHQPDHITANQLLKQVYEAIGDIPRSRTNKPITISAYKLKQQQTISANSEPIEIVSQSHKQTGLALLTIAQAMLDNKTELFPLAIEKEYFLLDVCKLVFESITINNLAPSISITKDELFQITKLLESDRFELLAAVATDLQQKFAQWLASPEYERWVKKHTLYGADAQINTEEVVLFDREKTNNGFGSVSHKKIAVILHLYYLDLWDEFELALIGIPQEFDLYISIPKGKAKNVSAEILKAFPHAKIYEFADKGRDILPFLTIFKEIQPLNYQLILKLHTKKSPHLKGYKGVDDFGGKWRKTTLSSLAQWNKRVNDIFDLFDSNPTLGIFSPFAHLYPFKSTDTNFQMINQLMPGIDEDSFNKKQFVYAGGSMFWFRPEAIERILKLDLTADNFEQESGQVDGTLAHAIERLFGVICQTSGYIVTDRMPKRDDIAYQGWLEKKREYDLAHDLLFLSDNLTKSVIHFFVYVDNEDLSMLANTIDSMGNQTYENWHLSVISSFSCPDEMFNDVSQLSWLQVEQQFDVPALLLKIGINTDWIGFLEVGDYLEPHALSCCVEYLNKNPQWQVVYTDEDRVSSEGFFHSPRFKLGFNLDLLYSVDYIGGLALFRAKFKTDASSQLKNLNYPNPFASYELVLHYLECFGESVIGHIESILLHRQEGIDQFFISQIEFRKVALANHFKAKRIDCSIDKGLVDGSFSINYQFKDEPKVSIIIPTKDQLPLLKACIESITEKTGYSNYEVIIIDNQSEKTETKNYFAEIQKTENRISVIEYQKPYNYSAVNNFAVEHATGDYLVLLNNDTMVLQEHWLQGMLTHVQRKEVGVVGVKLVFPNKTVQHAGVVLGMGGNGIAEHPHIGISMDGAGYMDRAMLTQEYSAVTAACLMIEKKLYQQVGGLDEEKFKILYNDVDFCLKVKELGFKVVWTPHVTLIHHGSSSLKKLKQDNKKLEQSQQEADNILEKWLPQLASDAAYNRNLSLKTTDFQVDISLNVSWNVDFKDKPRIYAFPLDSQGVGQYRVRAPLIALTRAGMVESSLANNFDSLIFPTAVEIERIKPDVLLIQNGFLDHMLTPWKRYRKFNDAFMVCGLDDLVYMLPQQHPKQGTWPKNIRRKVKELFQYSDRVVVANEALAEEFSKMTNEIVVVPNYLENSRWDSLTLPEKKVGEKLRVGWAGGQDHISDLQFILPIVEALHKEVDWIFMGLCLEQLKPFVKEIHGGIEFDLYPQKLADLNLDLAIAPLGHNKFNECKTNLRLLEYGVLAWPVVCSDILPYQNAPVTRVANNVQQWIKVIREKINEPDELHKEGAILQKWVKDNYMLDKHLDAWFSALMP